MLSAAQACVTADVARVEIEDVAGGNRQLVDVGFSVTAGSGWVFERVKLPKL